MLMVYLRTTNLRRKFTRYMNVLPDLFAGKLVEGVYLMKNSGKSMMLLLAEMQDEKGNIEVYLMEPIREDDILDDLDLRRIKPWLNEKNLVHQLLESEKKEELSREEEKLLTSLNRKRFSVHVKLT